MGSDANDGLEALEIELLTQGIFRHYGVDFRHYAYASLRRRIWNCVHAEKLATVTQLLDRVLRDTDVMERLLLQLSVNVTSMFRDPSFYRAFREKVVPLLRSHPFIRIWHAGCSTGEEVYSMAILLEEEGLYDRARLYATDMNEAVLAQARKGIFPTSVMAEYERNYALAGGAASLSDYYLARYDFALFRQSLRRNVVFAHHNLVTDGSFNEFNVILCRNVMIYFDRTLQGTAHRLFHASLRRFGVLALGRKESLRGTAHEHDYEAIDAAERIYRRSA
jgi:chemotaxis protein methyltransferase CheR